MRIRIRSCVQIALQAPLGHSVQMDRHPLDLVEETKSGDTDYLGLGQVTDLGIGPLEPNRVLGWEAQGTDVSQEAGYKPCWIIPAGILPVDRTDTTVRADEKVVRGEVGVAQAPRLARQHPWASRRRQDCHDANDQLTDPGAHGDA